MVDSNRVQGAMDKAKGAVKEGLGKVTGNKKLEAEGVADKAKGTAKTTVGKTPPTRSRRSLYTRKSRQCDTLVPTITGPRVTATRNDTVPVSHEPALPICRASARRGWLQGHGVGLAQPSTQTEEDPSRMRKDPFGTDMCRR
jgi:uncharacterized protein YjbJ (UPF0337 family)